MKIFTTLSLLLCIVGCSSWGRYHQILNQAESVIEHHTDSAYMLLSSIDFEDIRSEESRARYALLYTKIQDRQHIRIDSDSLISIALEYYQKHGHGSRYHTASAYYYSARVDWNRGDMPEAVRKFSYAEEMTPEDSLHLRGLIHNAIGMCYGVQYNPQKAIKSHEKAYDIFCTIGDLDNQAKSLYNLARIYASQRDFKRAIELTQKVKDIYHELRDTTNMLKNDVMIAQYRLHQTGDASHVKRLFFEARRHYEGYAESQIEHDLLAQLYRTEQRDSSLYYYKKVLATYDTTTLKRKATYFERRAQIASMMGNYMSAYLRLLRANEYFAEHYSANLENEVGVLHERYKGELHKSRAQHLRAERDGIYALCIVLMCLAAAIIFILTKHYKARLRKADEDLGAAQDLAQAIANTQAAIDISPVDSSDSERLDNINYMMSKLGSLIEDMPKYETRPRKFVDEFITIMRSQSQADDTKTIFYEIVNRSYTEVLTTIDKRYNLSAAEVEVLCMLALGISNNAIRILMNHSNNKTIYNIRSAIKSKLEIPLDSKSILEWLDAQR